MKHYQTSLPSTDNNLIQCLYPNMLTMNREDQFKLFSYKPHLSLPLARRHALLNQGCGYYSLNTDLLDARDVKAARFCTIGAFISSAICKAKSFLCFRSDQMIFVYKNDFHGHQNVLPWLLGTVMISGYHKFWRQKMKFIQHYNWGQ